MELLSATDDANTFANSTEALAPVVVALKFAAVRGLSSTRDCVVALGETGWMDAKQHAVDAFRGINARFVDNYDQYMNRIFRMHHFIEHAIIYVDVFAARGYLEGPG